MTFFDARTFKVSLILPLLLLMPGCRFLDFFKKDSAGSGTPVFLMGGKAVLASDDFDKNCEAAFAQQQGIKEVIAMLPAEQRRAVYEQIADQMIAEFLMAAAAEKEGLTNDPAYVADLEYMLRTIKRTLAARAYQAKILEDLAVSEDEARAFYENAAQDPRLAQYLSRPPFMNAIGGVKAWGFAVSDEGEAKKLAERARQGRSMEALAKEAGTSATNFGVVTAQSPNVDALVRMKIVDMEKFPSVIVVKGTDKKFYVVKGTARTEPQRASFDEIKDAVMQLAREAKFQEALVQKLQQLRDELGFTINNEYFDAAFPVEVAQAPAQDEVAEAVAAAAEATANPLQAASADAAHKPQAA